MIRAPMFAARNDQMICCSQRSLIRLPFTKIRFGGTRFSVVAVMAPSDPGEHALPGGIRPVTQDHDSGRLATRPVTLRRKHVRAQTTQAPISRGYRRCTTLRSARMRLTLDFRDDRAPWPGQPGIATPSADSA